MQLQRLRPQLAEFLLTASANGSQGQTLVSGKVESLLAVHSTDVTGGGACIGFWGSQAIHSHPAIPLRLADPAVDCITLISSSLSTHTHSEADKTAYARSLAA